MDIKGKSMKSILIKDTTIREINMEFRARYESGIEGPEKTGCGFK